MRIASHNSVVGSRMFEQYGFAYACSVHERYVGAKLVPFEAHVHLYWMIILGPFGAVDAIFSPTR